MQNELDMAKNQFVNVTQDTALKQRNLSILPQIIKLFDDNGKYMRELSFIRFYQLNFDQKSPTAKAIQFEKLFIKSLEIKAPSAAENKQRYDQKLIIANSFDVMKHQFIADPTILDKAMKQKKTNLPKFIASMGLERVVSGANLYLNYLEKVGFDLLIEAEDLIENQVGKGKKGSSQQTCSNHFFYRHLREPTTCGNLEDIAMNLYTCCRTIQTHSSQSLILPNMLKSL